MPKGDLKRMWVLDMVSTFGNNTFTTVGATQKYNDMFPRNPRTSHSIGHSLVILERYGILEDAGTTMIQTMSNSTKRAKLWRKVK